MGVMCVCGVLGGLLKMHTQMSRWDDFLTLLVVKPLVYCLDVNFLTIFKHDICFP